MDWNRPFLESLASIQRDERNERARLRDERAWLEPDDCGDDEQDVYLDGDL